MTAQELEIAIREHEMQRLELKESFNVECIETACAFANASGGYIVLGVDNNGNPSKAQLRFEALRDYENRIATATEPSVSVDAEKVAFRSATVVVLKVPENPLKPVAYKGRSFMRKGSVNHQMTPVEIAECHLKSTGTSMDAVIMPGVTRDDLDMGEVRRYMAKAIAEGRRNFSQGEDPWLVLKKLQLVKSETEITRAAYLLFAKEPQIMFSQAIIHAGAFRDEGALILDSCDVGGNIQNQVDKTIDFIKRNIRRSIVVSGKAEHDRVWEYPIEALRETITNAICHRDYCSPHDIQIKILEDRLVVISPGLLPFDMGLEMLENPEHGSRPRNKLVAQVFYDMHLIEHYGSGTRRIKDECLKNGNKIPRWSQQYGSFITVYDSRLKEDGHGTTDTINGTINQRHEVVNGSNESVKIENEPLNGRHDTIKSTDDTINDTIKRPDDTIKQALFNAINQKEGMKREALAKVINRAVPTVARLLAELERDGKIIYRGSKKTGGYYPVQ